MAERLSLEDDTFLYGYEQHIQRYRFAGERVKGKRVIDAGCGVGYGTSHLDRSGCASVVGVDLSTEALAQARKAFANDRVRFVQGNLEKLDEIPDLPSEVDVIVNMENLEHLHKPKAFLEAARARLKRPDGMLLTSTPNGLLTEFDEHGRNVNPYHIKEYTHDEFLELLKPYFSRIEMFGQWETNDRKLRLAEERHAFQQICETYYSPVMRASRLALKLLGRTPPAPPEYRGLGASYSWEHVIAPCKEPPYTWEPVVIIAVCTD